MNYLIFFGWGAVPNSEYLTIDDDERITYKIVGKTEPNLSKLEPGDIAILHEVNEKLGNFKKNIREEPKVTRSTRYLLGFFL